jgi:hypothetical protein
MDFFLHAAQSERSCVPRWPSRVTQWGNVGSSAACHPGGTCNQLCPSNFRPLRLNTKSFIFSTPSEFEIRQHVQSSERPGHDVRPVRNPHELQAVILGENDLKSRVTTARRSVRDQISRARRRPAQLHTRATRSRMFTFDARKSGGPC